MKQLSRNYARLALALCLGFGAAGPALADLNPPATLGSATTSAALGQSAHAPALPSTPPSLGGVSQSSLEWGPFAPGESESAAVGHQVLDLPGSPSSAGLFLSAALSVAAWHVFRSAKHLHLAHLPDWYHSGGPVQVGHVVPFDLDFGAFLPSSFDSAVIEPVLALRRVESHPVWRLLSQCALILAAPRGPPSSF